MRIRGPYLSDVIRRAGIKPGERRQNEATLLARRCAQLIARCRSVAAASLRSLAAAACVLGTTFARSGLAGANQLVGAVELVFTFQEIHVRLPVAKSMLSPNGTRMPSRGSSLGL